MWEWKADCPGWFHRGSLLLSALVGHDWHFMRTTGVIVGYVQSRRFKIKQVSFWDADFNNGEPEKLLEYAV